ncbi:hypothetical protein LG315_03470 [Microbacterium marinum]|uniref:hypothetical protein n=1 Tax=Microbacterium marinum TaxID=421115 RepID=UPI00384C7645
MTPALGPHDLTTSAPPFLRALLDFAAVRESEPLPVEVTMELIALVLAFALLAAATR